MASRYAATCGMLVLAGALLAVTTAAATGKSSPVVAIIKSGSLPQFEEATAAIVKRLKSDPLQPEILTFDLEGEAKKAAGILEDIGRAQAGVIITVGSLATSVALGEQTTTTPVVFSMVLYPEESGFHSTPERRVTGASLDIPVDVQFAYLRRLLPTAKRIGVLFNPSETGAVIAEAKAAAPKHGFTLVAREVSDSTGAVGALQALMEGVDLVWAVADSHVFSPQTTSALILASLQRSVPLIGLSAQHVRAGALAALYCDYGDIGDQAAAAALRILRGDKTETIPVAAPRRIGLALNLHTAEHLSVPVSTDLQKEAEIVR